MELKKIMVLVGCLLVSLALFAQAPRVKVLLYDDFDDNQKDWPLIQNKEVGFSMNPGLYAIEYKSKGGSWSSFLNIEKFKSDVDFSVETSLGYVSGDADESFGLIFGRLDAQNQFSFEISASGMFQIVSNFRSKTEQIANWTRCSALKTGRNVYNSMKVVREDGIMKYYINSIFVFGHPARTMPGTRFGFVVGGVKTVMVDYISVKQKQVFEATNPYAQNKYQYNKVSELSNPPVIEIYEPQMSRGFKLLRQSSVKVSGKIEASNGISRVSINNTAVSVTETGFFSVEVPLALGENTIEVLAEDLKQKRTVRNFMLNREGEAKEVVNQQNQKRLAFIIGNSHYANGPTVETAIPDSRSLKLSLERLGFEVMLFEDLNQRDLRVAMDEFGAKLISYDVALFYYAGYGIQVDGVNYLIPVNASVKSESEVEYDCVPASRVLAKMEACQTKTNIVILDACIDNPFEAKWPRPASSKGLAFMDAPSGSFIAYATSPGKTLGPNISSGLYVSAIIENIDIASLPIEELFKKVRSRVRQTSGDTQIPWESTSLNGNFYFRP